MEDVKADGEEGCDKSAEAQKAEKEAEVTAAAKAEELRIALETKTEQGKSTLGDLPKP
jgi:hypothetical protein